MQQQPDSAPVVAFFDVDNTLMRGASLYHVGWAAWRRGLISARDVARFVWAQLRFIARGEHLGHVDSVRERALRLVAGRQVPQLQQLGVEVFEERIKDRLRPQMVALTRDHLDRGHEVWLVTATPKDVAMSIAQHLGLTGALGTELEAVDGVYTGRLAGRLVHGGHKAEAAVELAEAVGADLSRSWAYSDSRNDIPLLEAVGNPVVVNPDKGLRKYAQTRGWPVMQLRSSRRVKDADKES